MNGRSVVAVAVVVGALACLSVVAALPEATALQKIQPLVLRLTDGGHQAEFFVILKDQADLSYAEGLSTKEAKGVYVYGVLQDKAEQSQAPIRTLLESRGIEYQPFFIVNAILVKVGDRDLAMELAGREDVDRIEGNPVIQNDLPKPEAVEDKGFNGFAVCANETAGPNVPQAVEWNVTKVNAPGVWALGFRGQGIVVGAQDTGYRWTHTFIKNQYRGWNGVTADHNYNWHDSVHSGGVGGTCTGPDMLFPCDDHGHGTHTISTVLGSDGGANETGVAPQAKWIGCRDMNVGAGTPATYLECMEFFLAPTMLNGTNPDPTKAPHVTTNSWGCPTDEGCSWNTLLTAVDNQKAAGIMTVVAAGNSGSSCNTVTDAPAMYLSAYTVGSTTSSDAMSSFSSRGVGTGNGAMKPDIVAPGSSVRGATNTSDTATMTISGTSMATPHVAGVVALLWSARSCLTRQQDLTAARLNATATRLTSIVESCGGNYVTGPNNTWGNGLINALAAVNGYSCCTTPGVPTIGTASVPGNNQITVSWTAGTPAGTTYSIYRSAGACPGSVFTLVKSGQASSPWTDATVSGGLTYAYKVTAVDTTGGCESAQSGCVTATATGPCTEPPTFAGISGVSNPQSATCTLDLSWSAASSVCPGEITYKVYRSVTTPVAAVPGNVVAPGVIGTSYSDSGALTSGTTYYYVVHAVVGTSLEETNTAERSGAPTGTITPANLLAESFDGSTFPPAGWSQTDTSGTDGAWARSTATVHPTGGTTHTGAGLAYFNSYTAAATSATRLNRTSATALPGTATSATASLWMYHDTGYTTDTDRVQVQVSTNGTTWTDAGTAINRYDGTTGWKQHSVSLNAYIGQSIYLGFNGISEYGNDVHIDDVSLDILTSATCTTSSPAPGETAPGDLVGTAQAWAADKATHTWPANAQATGYKVLRGTPAQLPDLLTASTDHCVKWTGATTNCTLDDTPAMGSFYWYIVIGTNTGGDGHPGYATGAVARVVNSTGSCL